MSSPPLFLLGSPKQAVPVVQIIGRKRPSVVSLMCLYWLLSSLAEFGAFSAPNGVENRP
jgi:hypothetical protein